MLQVFEDYLFSQGYFVAESSTESTRVSAHAAEALVALAHYAEIRITEHPEWADPEMLAVARRNIGFDVPVAFYRGFPASVRALSPDKLAFDQLWHYFRTYGLGDFSQPGHSVFEECYGRAAFAEHVTPKDFAIITLSEAEDMLARMASGFLASTRPLNDRNYQLLLAYIETYPAFPAARCASKDTAVRLLIDARDAGLARLIELPDVIRLVEWLLALHYEGASIRKLNLKNRDRKLIAGVLDVLFARGAVDVATCLEKKKAWNGLLHHLHYRPSNARAEAFCQAIRGKEQRSVYSAMERCLAVGDVRGAVDVLHARKGPGAVLRHLDHLLSRIDGIESGYAARPDDEVAYVLDACKTDNKIILVQLLQKHGFRRYQAHGEGERVFTFTHMGMLRRHRETPTERALRKTLLPMELEDRVTAWLREQLALACRGVLGRVYADESMRNIALPLQEAASMGGFETLPRGTRIPLPADKKVRAFTYWEKVNDIDLSCMLLNDDGSSQEFSWRTMAGLQSPAITFSGDETSGYDGGAEYYDIDLPEFVKRVSPQGAYLVLCDNVYSYTTFDKCRCRAGYMLRDIDDSGEIFEPATVKSSFVINCNSRSAFLFAIDLRDPAIIWLGQAEDSMQNIAGNGDVSFLMGYLHTTDIMNLRDFAHLLATEVVDDPAKADVVFSDESFRQLGLREDQELIGSRNTARLLELLN